MSLQARRVTEQRADADEVLTISASRNIQNLREIRHPVAAAAAAAAFNKHNQVSSIDIWN